MDFKILPNNESPLGEFNPITYLSNLGKNELFFQDEDICGLKGYISFMINYEKSAKKNLIAIFILVFTNFFYGPDRSNQLFLLYSSFNLNFSCKKEKLSISFENSLKITPAFNLLNFLNFTFTFTIFGRMSDLYWIDLCFSTCLNFEILFINDISFFKLFQFNFFISFNTLEYFTDLSLTEHSISIGKNLIDFYTDSNGFFRQIKYSPSGCRWIIDNVSKTYYDTIRILKLKKSVQLEKSFLFLTPYRKHFMSENYSLILSKSYIKLSTRFSEIIFFPITNFSKKYNLKKNSSSIYLILRLQELYSSNPFFSQNLSKSIHVNEILKNSIDFYWYTLFFSFKQHSAHFIISWILSKFIFIPKKFLEIEILTRFIRLILLLNIEKTSCCLTKLIQRTSQKHILLDNLTWLKIFNIYSFLSINQSELNLADEKRQKNLKKQINTSKKKEIIVPLHLWKTNQNIPPYKIKSLKKYLFSLKNRRIGNLIEDSIKNSKILQKIEIKVNYFILKIIGFNNTLCLLIYLFSILKIKCPFSFVIEVLRKQNQKLRNLIKNKSNRFLVIKVLIKSTLKRLKISRISILENLIPFRLVNVNYLPRTLFERKLEKNFTLNSALEKVNFFYNRIINWKQTTRSDRNALKNFLKVSYKREQKIALKTIFKVKKAKNLFIIGVWNFCCNFLEAISFFISFKIYIFEKHWLGKNKTSLLKINLNEIIQINFFFKLYLKRIKLFLYNGST